MVLRSNVGDVSEYERHDGENDKDDYEPFGDIHTETGDPSHTKDDRGYCQYQEKNREFDKVSSGLQREYLKTSVCSPTE
jgi:hypothetical protein